VQQDKHDGSGFLNSHRGDVDRDSSSVSRSKIGVPHAEPSSLNYSLGLGLRSPLEESTCVVRVPIARSTAVASSSNRCGPTITWQSRIRIRPPQLNKGNRTQFDPPVIPTGRRLKTSACLRFYAVFSWVCTHRPSLRLSVARCLCAYMREASLVLFLPLATRLSGVSKSRDPEVIEKSRTS
jgi:hypothetical protein